MVINSFTYSSATLGCKVNQAETSELESALTNRGWLRVTSQPTVYLVNTCAVTRVSEAKSRRLINRIIRENPDSRIVVTGCYASRHPGEISRYIRPGFDLSIPQEDKERIPELLSYSNQTNPPSVPPWRDNPKSYRFRTRAFLKIQDGCDNFCSYCIVPFLRGQPTSKPLEDVIKEATDLVTAGYKEIVLVGINLGNYSNLPGLLQRLVALGGLERIRLSSIEVNDITTDLLEVMRRYPKICPHLHIPLQSGSNRILKMMNRRYTAGGYLEKINEIRQYLTNPGITTDIIVGFPGETSADFAETIGLSRRVGFSKIHIFPYSPRPGTKAEMLNNRVPGSVVKERCRQLNIRQKEWAWLYKRQFIEREVTILLEGAGENGFTSEYLKVSLNTPRPNEVNKLIRCRIKKATDEYLMGD